MLTPIPIPGLFITGTDTNVGKTIIAGAIANHLHLRGHKVAVCKLAATGCPHRREGLVSEDAEYLAHCADADFPLDIICPQRYAEPLAPAVAAQRANDPLDWSAIQRSLSAMSRTSQIMIVEGVGGLMTPMDNQHTILDTIKWLQLPAIIVARATLGTINHTLLTIDALRRAQAPIAGVVINQYPSDSPGPAEETNPAAIEKWGKISVLCIAPHEKFTPPTIPRGVVAAINNVDWEALAHKSKT